MNNRIQVVCTAFLLAGMAIAFLQCTSESSSEPAQYYDASDRAFGNAPFVNIHTLAVANPIGYVVIAGNGPDTTLSWYMYRTVSATSPELAQAQLSALTLSTHTTGDSMFVTPQTPSSPAGVIYSCLVSLTLTDSVQCVIGPVQHDVNISYMHGPVFVNAGGSVAIDGHIGSCSVVTLNGDVSIEQVLGLSDSCVCSVTSGTITIQIPAATQASVTAQTGSGTITSSGLSYSDSSTTGGKFSGTLGLGGATIRLQTGAGNISIVGF